MNTIYKPFIVAVILITNLIFNTTLEAQVCVIKNETSYELSLAFNGFDRVVQAGKEAEIPLELFDKLSKSIKIKHRFSGRENNVFQLLGLLDLKLFLKPGLYRFWQARLSGAVFLDTPDVGFIELKKSIR